MTQVVVVSVFGGFSLEVEGEAKGATVPRRLAAILGILALVGERGISRDRLVHLLWSESDADRSRHALTQSLYSLRRLLGRDDVIVGTTHLALSQETARTDVAALETAIRARDAEGALEHFRGEPLEGLAVPGAPDFERWLEEQRSSWTHRVSALLDSTASAAAAGGQYTAAVQLRRRRATLDPLDATSCLDLMRALALAGDTPGAFQHARVYGELVRQQLEMEPDPRIGALVAELRQAAQTALPDVAPPLTLRTFADRLPGGDSLQRAIGQLMGAIRRWTGWTVWRGASVPRDVVRAVQVSGLVLIVAVTAMAVIDRVRRRTPPPSGAGRAVIAVLPFRADAVDSGLAFLGTGIVGLLTDAIRERDSVAIAADDDVLRWWRRVGALAAQVSEDSMRRAAADLAATDLVVGRLVGSRTQLVLTAEWRPRGSDTVRARVSASGPLDSLAPIIGRIATLLVAARHGEGTEHLTADLAPGALRAWLRGRAAYRRLDYRVAAGAFMEALLLDSAFAPAAVGLALASDWEDEPSQMIAALERVRRSGYRLSPTAQLQVHALHASSMPVRGEELAATWERAAQTANQPEWWVELGRRLHHDGAQAGLRDPVGRSRDAYRRALALDSTNASARLSLAELDLAELVPSPSIAEAATLPAQWSIATATGDERAMVAVQAAMRTASPEALRRVAIRALWAERSSDVARALGSLRETIPVQEPELAILGEHAAALSTGDRVRALEATRQLGDVVGNGAHLRLRVLDALYGGGDTTAALDAIPRLLARSVGDAPSEDAGARRSDLCVLAQWRLARGDSAPVMASIRQLEQQPVPPAVTPVTSGSLACAHLLRAMLAVKTSQVGAPEVLLRAEQLAFLGTGAGDLRHYGPLALARLRLERGDTARARWLVGRRGGERGWPRYAASYLDLERRLARVDSVRVMP